MELFGPWMRIEVTRPAWLAALAVLPLVVYYARRSLTGFPAWRRAASLACRVLLLVVLVLAMCDVRLAGPSGEQIMLPPVDDSESVVEPSSQAAETSAAPEVLVSEVRTDRRVREGEPFYVEVIVDSNRDNRGDVELLSDGRRLERRQVRLGKGETCVRFAAMVDKTPLARFTARLSGFQDTLPGNNEAESAVFAGPRPRVLLVEGEPLLGQHLNAALRRQRMEVETRLPLDMPKTAGDLDRFDLVVLANVPALAANPQTVKLLQSYVGEAGGGLIAVGGDRSLTPGGYHNTLLEQILPVQCEYDARRSHPILAMVVILDRSGSMQGKPIELAKEATRRAVQLLDPRDQVGLIAFGDDSQWVFPLQICKDKARLGKDLDAVKAEGRTNMYPAMEQAYQALKKTSAQRKHILLLTDGASEPGDFETLATRAAAAGISVSTVGVGREVVRPLLQQLARQGKGHSYFCDDMAAAPKIFALETAAAAKLGIVERSFRPQVAHPAPSPMPPTGEPFPALQGYVGTLAKPGSRVLLASDTGDPLLVWWRYGQGVCAAFTSDVQSRWAGDWLVWRGFDPFWGQLARLAMRRGEPDDCTLRVETRHGEATATLDAADSRGRFLNGAAAVITVLDPQRISHRIVLDQVAPGRYAASFPVRGPGTYYLETTLSDGGRPLVDERRGLVVGLGGEVAGRKGNSRHLQERPGGTSIPEPDHLVVHSANSMWRTLHARRPLLVVALLVFVLDVALRRVVWFGSLNREVSGGPR